MKLYRAFLDVDNNEQYECHENFEQFVGIFDSEEKAQAAIDDIKARHKALDGKPIDEWHNYEYKDEGDDYWTFVKRSYIFTYSPFIEEIELNQYDPEIA